MTGTTSLSSHDPMRYKILLAGIEKFPHILMTNHAELGFTIGPKLKFITATMRIVADGAIPGTNRPMDVAHARPFLLVDMTVITEPLNLTAGHHYLLRISG